MTKLTIDNALEALKNHDQAFIEIFTHGSLSIEFYKPAQLDHQTPHTRDEIYVIASGTGYFYNGKTREAFANGDVFFVPAGEVHKFEDFTENFSTWVFFFGSENGTSEQAN